MKQIKAIQMSPNGKILGQIEIDDPKLFDFFAKLPEGREGMFAMELTDKGEILSNRKLNDREIPDELAKLFEDAISGHRLKKKYDVSKFKPFRCK